MGSYEISAMSNEWGGIVLGSQFSVLSWKKMQGARHVGMPAREELGKTLVCR